ncbi:MAG: sulfatase-like hydrolase/transferase [Actinomycetota bacterium]|nr:sulfatase-like hydrolase/transferase [Actinomycetota bacterium]
MRITLVSPSVRRLSLALVVALATGTASSGPAEAAGDGRPNIILVMTDDLDVATAQHLPRLQALLADEGITFARSFVTNSLCCPSRATSLRGQYAHNHQIKQNREPLGGWDKFRRLGHENSTIGTWMQAGAIGPTTSAST